ncbi:MAG: hypothetical protein JEZ03_10160 [Bacteroidales bacterium]|nr:hypothetical protein [Bacteroidales bacterium]
MSKIIKLSIVVILGLLLSFCHKPAFYKKDFVFSGTVVEHTTNNPVAGVTISIAKINSLTIEPAYIGECITNAEGEYLVLFSGIDKYTFGFELTPQIEDSGDYKVASQSQIEEIECDDTYEVTQDFVLEQSSK